MTRAVSILTAVFLMAPLLFAVNAQAADCNEKQAYNTMLAFNRALSRMMAQSNMTPNSPGIKAATESAPAGQLIADKKFAQACRKYQELAKKYQVDLAKEADGLITMEQAEKDGGKGSGGCSQADAHMKMMNMHQQLEDKAATGDVEHKQSLKFAEETKAFGDLIFTNPSEMCRRLDALKPKYGLN